MELLDFDPECEVEIDPEVYGKPAVASLSRPISSMSNRSRRSSARRNSPHGSSPHGSSGLPLCASPLQQSKQGKLPNIMVLNVGGVYFTTRRSTLCKYEDSMLAAMFSGRHVLETDSSGAYFIDSNGSYFGYILDFLRNELLPPNDVAESVLSEALYYGLIELQERLSVMPSISARLVKENHRQQFPDYQEVKRKVVQIAVENATVSKVGEVVIFAFRQRFTPKAPNFNVNHSCVADQAHISVGPWDSVADEETFIKCLESDLMEEEFNVRMHEGKRRCKYFYGQSCQKCVFRIQLVFY